MPSGLRNLISSTTLSEATRFVCGISYIPTSSRSGGRVAGGREMSWRHHGRMDIGLTAERLRGIPSLTGRPPHLGVEDRPAEPTPLFIRWLDDAIEAGVAEPHVATLATVDLDGVPDARSLILKGLDDRGWAVAGRRSSRKGEQLATQPAAALNFWWQPIMRAVRVRGRVEEASREDSGSDFAARSESARAGIDPGDWVVWRLQPSRVEFWQGSTDRRHLRIVYVASSTGWELAESIGERTGGDKDVEGPT